MDGLLLVDKPLGWTSHDAVAYIRKALGEKRVGHTGTLDPLATGLIIVLVGKATRLARYFEEDIKQYAATMRLGAETDTQDLEGKVIRECAVPVLTDDAVRAVFANFTGEQLQTPPMFSAVKVGGVRLYAQARAGVEVERAAKRVSISSLDLLGIEGDTVSFRTVCSKGTYIRTLCRDMGEAMGTCAHLIRLRRTGVGPHGVDGALRLEARPNGEAAREKLIPLDAMLVYLPRVVVRGSSTARIKDGRGPEVDDIIDAKIPDKDGPVRVLSESGALMGMGETDGSRIRMKVVLI